MSDFFTDLLGIALYGGGEESRTPVQYFFHTNIYECSLLLEFLYNIINKQTIL